jgi:hypothetical protein
MAVASVTLQEVNAQTSAAPSMLKKNAQAGQAAVNARAQSAQPGGRGQKLDITV